MSAMSRRLAIVAVLIAACGAPAATSPPPAGSPGTSAPASDATTAPGPTMTWATPLRDAVWVNPTVVERPGVPRDLRDRYWWTLGGDAGRIGTTAQLGLPAGEQIETVQDGIVVAARWPAENPSGELDLVVHEFDSGDLIRVIPTALRTVDAELFGSTVFWTGVHAGDPDAVVDGGVWSVDVRTSDEPAAIVEPGTPLLGALCGRGLDASPTRMTLSARAVCRGKRLWTDLVDAETQTLSARLEERWVLALTDDTYLLANFFPSEFLTPGVGDVAAYDRRTGDLLWSFPEPSEVEQFASGHWVPLGSMFVTHAHWRTEDRQEVVLTAIDARSGERHELLRQVDNGAILWASLNASSSEHLIMTNGWDLSRQIALDGTPISLLGVADGVLDEDAFEIDPPVLCSNEFCRKG